QRRSDAGRGAGDQDGAPVAQAATGQEECGAKAASDGGSSASRSAMVIFDRASPAARSAAVRALATWRGMWVLTGQCLAPAGGEPRWAQPFTALSTTSRVMASGRCNSQAPPEAPGRVAIRPALASKAVTRRTTTGFVGTEAASTALGAAAAGE